MKISGTSLGPVLLALLVVAFPACKSSPTVSSLSESDLALPRVPVAPMPVGDVYEDEELVRRDLPLTKGDVIEVLLKQGDAEEVFRRTVNDKGEVRIALKKISVAGVTLEEAEERIEKALGPYYRQLAVQATIVSKKAKVKRVFVFGEVKNPGVLPMTRDMTVLNVLAKSQYNEGARLDDIKIVRYKPDHREILTADLARMFTYGDWSQNLSLEENDVVYLPRTGLGDAQAFGQMLGPLFWMYTSPIYSATIIKSFVAP